MDTTETARAYRRRADAREAERVERYRTLHDEARRIAAALHDAFGPRVRVHLFGSLLDLERYRGDSDLDIAVEGLEPPEYWEAWQIVDSVAQEARVDLVRVETAPPSLRECIRSEGRVLT